MSRASSLYRLQQVDSQLDQVRARLAEIERLLADAEPVATARREYEAKEAALRETQAAHRRAEDAVRLQEEKLEQTESLLYGGTVKNPKELQDLQREAEALKRHLATLEDRLLEAMVALEEAQQAHQAAKAHLERVEAEHAAAHEDLLQERASLQAREQELLEAREAAVAGVAQSDLALYEELRQSSGGLAVVQVEEGGCPACGMRLSASTRQAVRSGNELVRCGQCGRILFGG